jgi:hypothetical protein
MLSGALLRNHRDEDFVMIIFLLSRFPNASAEFFMNFS